VFFNKIIVIVIVKLLTDITYKYHIIGIIFFAKFSLVGQFRC